MPNRYQDDDIEKVLVFISSILIAIWYKIILRNINQVIISTHFFINKYDISIYNHIFVRLIKLLFLNK